jgi:hypothetical protein
MMLAVVTCGSSGCRGDANDDERPTSPERYGPTLLTPEAFAPKAKGGGPAPADAESTTCGDAGVAPCGDAGAAGVPPKR